MEFGQEVASCLKDNLLESGLALGQMMAMSRQPAPKFLLSCLPLAFESKAIVEQRQLYGRTSRDPSTSSLSPFLAITWGW